MTVAEYMNPTQFPLTTQPGLPPADQLFIDAFNYDEMMAARERGEQFSPQQLAAAAELEAKHAARAEVAQQLKIAPPPQPGQFPSAS